MFLPQASIFWPLRHTADNASFQTDPRLSCNAPAKKAITLRQKPSHLVPPARKLTKERKQECSHLVSLNPENPAYIQLEKHFQDGWKHPHKPKPRVQAIFEIVLPDNLLNPYWRYRARVAVTRAFGGANEQLLFHGTNRECSLGDSNGQWTRLCSASECLLCAVIRNSFDVARSGKRHGFSRFGRGIYTTACSSKADDYYNGLDNSFRAVLVNRVVVGTPSTHTHNAKGLTVPPSGYHSVVGVPGADLNYEETVVYSNNAIRPAYLVVYDY